MSFSFFPTASFQSRLIRTIVVTFVIACVQVIPTESTNAADVVQPTPSIDLANGNTTGAYANGQISRSTTYLDSTTVSITELGVNPTIPGFTTTYVNDTYNLNAIYPIGSITMGPSWWGNYWGNSSFFTSPGYAFPAVKNSTGSLFAYNAFKAANYLDSTTGTVVGPTPTNKSSVQALNIRDHGLCAGFLPTDTGTLTICPNLGRVTFSFSRPVTNAILNIADLGGYGYLCSDNSTTANCDNSITNQVSVAGDLKINTALSPGVATLGNGAADIRKITSNPTLKIDTSTSVARIYNPIIGNSYPSGANGQNWAQPFGYGSTMVRGTYSSITIDIGLSVFWAMRSGTTQISNPGQYATDYFGMSWSLQSLAIYPHEHWMGTSNILTSGNAGIDAVKVVGASFSQASSPAHGTITNFDTATGTYTYTPNAGYAGDDTFLVNLCAPAPNADYCVQAQETIHITKPVATSETKTALVDVPITFTKIQGSGTALAAPGTFGYLETSTAGAPCLINPTGGACVRTPITVAEGVFSIATTTSVVTFTPNSGFIGTATTLTYKVTDNYGDTATATLTPIYSTTPPPAPAPSPPPAPAPSPPPAPVASPAPVLPPTAQPAIATVLNPVTAELAITATPGSAVIVPSKTVLVDPTTSAGVQSVEIPSQGTYTLDLATQKIKFKALPIFTGEANPITYRVFDANGLSATSTVTPTIIGRPTATPDRTVISVDNVASLKISPVAGTLTTIDATQSCFVDALLNQCLTDYTVRDQGRWKLDRTTNLVTFTPFKGYSGPVTQLRYRIFDNYGQSAESTLDVTIVKPALVESVAPAVTNEPVKKTASMTWKINRICEFHQITVRLKSQTMELCDPQTGEAYAIKVCTGKDVTPTYTGWFKPNSFVPGFMNGNGNQKMYYSVFFFKRIAIHGSKNVLDGKCSRGCVRVPMELAKKVYAFAKVPHTQIFVKN